MTCIVFPHASGTVAMGRTPYMEIGAGIDNILTILRVDYIWRLTYRDMPGIDKRGLRISLHFSFLRNALQRVSLSEIFINFA